NPPPCSRGAGGSCVKTATLSLLPPLQRSIKTTENNGTRAIIVVTVTKALINALNRVRGRRNDRSSSEKSTPSKGFNSGAERKVVSVVAIILPPCRPTRVG